MELTGSEEIGLYLLGSVLLRFSYSGFSFAILHSSETAESLMERLHICVIGVAKTFDPSFRKRPDRLSIPVAFSVFNSFRKLDFGKMKMVFFKIQRLIKFSH